MKSYVCTVILMPQYRRKAKYKDGAQEEGIVQTGYVLFIQYVYIEGRQSIVGRV